MIEYIFNPTLWGILGLILIVLELTDGSKIFFLPFGLASIANGILIYFQNNGSFNELRHGYLFTLYAGFSSN